MGKLALKLTQIASLADRELGQAWREAYACEPPALPADLLRLGIAYAVQEQAGGRLAARHRKALEPGARRLTGCERSDNQDENRLLGCR